MCFSSYNQSVSVYLERNLGFPCYSVTFTGNICLDLSKPGRSMKSDVSILELVRFCANWLKTQQEREKRTTALKGREERGEEKKRLTFPLVFISSSLEICA